MKKLLLALLLIAPLGVQALPYQLQATSANPYLPSFTIDFDDTGDRKLQIDEITGFSGFNIGRDFFSTVLQTPNIRGVVTQSADIRNNESPGYFWVFGSSVSQIGLYRAHFAYDVSAVKSTGTTAVPEPGVLGLFGLGFVGLVLARRNRRSI